MSERAEDAAERLVAEEVDPLLGEVELHVARRGVGEAPRSGDGLLTGGHLGRSVDVQVALVHEALDEVVEHLRELRLRLLVTVAPQRLEHLGGELPALDEGVEDRLLERVERAVLVAPELSPVGVVVLAPREPRLEKEVGELVEQRLQVDRVGELGGELRVGVGTHAARGEGGSGVAGAGSRVACLPNPTEPAKVPHVTPCRWA